MTIQFIRRLRLEQESEQHYIYFKHRVVVTYRFADNYSTFYRVQHQTGLRLIAIIRTLVFVVKDSNGL